MEESKPYNSISPIVMQIKSPMDRFDFSCMEERSIHNPINLEDESTSLFSCHFITPDKEEYKMNTKKQEDAYKRDLDFTLSCDSKEKTGCFASPADNLILTSEHNNEVKVKKQNLAEMLIPEMLNNDTGSLEMLKMILQAKSVTKTSDCSVNNQTINIIDDMKSKQTSGNLNHNMLQKQITNQKPHMDLIEPMHNLTSIKKNQKTTKCKCSKSKCLKLYCECFAAQGSCGVECGCTDCYNNDDYKELKAIVVKDILEKNPKAFDNKYKKISKQNIKLHSRGCNCKRSGCNKKYCECFGEGLKCTNMCKCLGCDNCGPHLEIQEIDEVHEVIKRKRKRKKPFVNVLIEKLELYKKIERHCD